MYASNDIVRKIDKYEEQNEQLRRQIELNHKRIRELRSLPVLDEEGEITSYEDWAA